MAGRVKIPTGDKITIEHGKLRVPDNPIIAFIEGDGTGQDKVNPGSVILSGEMMFRYMGWNEAADRIVAGLETTIGQKVVTYDFARLTEGAKEVKCSEFGTAIIANMKKL